MITLIGPCMFAAPLMIVLVPIAVVLWPVVLLGVGIVWVASWPFARLAAAWGGTWLPAKHAALGRAFRTLLTPWTYFDVP